MYKYLNLLLSSKLYDKFPIFVARKIFKIFKIFFVETKLETLPKNNHPTKLNKEDQIKILNNSNDVFYKPFNTCSYLLELLTLYQTTKTNLKILDFGSNNIDNYVYLNRYLNNWKYHYHDLEQYNQIISELVREKKLKNIKVVNKLSEINEQLDFGLFGSSIHYINDYKNIINFFSKNKTKYLIFSHTPFYTSDKHDKDIVLKQLNIFPIINYAYLINYNNFIKFMEENNYKLIAQNKNNFIKFLNFKNFKDFMSINFLDLIFVYN